MGQKVHPTGFRLGISRPWSATWFSEGAEFGKTLNQDMVLRKFLKKRLANASVSRVDIERRSQQIDLFVHTARPGIVIGKKGEDIDSLRREVAGLMNLSVGNIKIAIEEIRKPETDAQLVAEGIAQQLEKRIMFRRAMKRAVSNAMRQGAGGVKVHVSGRLNGAEIARSEWYREGRVPLHTLRADIDYGFAEAHTTYGVIGIKVWVFKGEVFEFDASSARASSQAN